MLLLHHFSSPLWSQFLKDHLPFSNTLLSKVMKLKVGRMIIFTPNNDDGLALNYNGKENENNYSKLQSNSNSYMVILRKRITTT